MAKGIRCSPIQSIHLVHASDRPLKLLAEVCRRL